MVARGRFELPSMGLFLVFGVQSPSLAGSFSTLASPLHHRATRDPGPGPSPNKPSANTPTRIVDHNRTRSQLLARPQHDSVIWGCRLLSTRLDEGHWRASSTMLEMNNSRLNRNPRPFTSAWKRSQVLACLAG